MTRCALRKRRFNLGKNLYLIYLHELHWDRTFEQALVVMVVRLHLSSLDNSSLEDNESLQEAEDTMGSLSIEYSDRLLGYMAVDKQDFALVLGCNHMMALPKKKLIIKKNR